MDVLDKKQRSYCMSQIRSAGTTPELLFRSSLSFHGIRGYRVKTKIIGKPDVYFPAKKLAIFIDGCFWHCCNKCFIRPKTRRDFWTPKLRQNVERDRKVNVLLRKQNVIVLRFWEHEIENNIDGCYRRFIKIYDKKTT